MQPSTRNTKLTHAPQFQRHITQNLLLLSAAPEHISKRIAPEGYAFPGDPRNWEQEKYKTAKLSKLGEKILGLQKW